MMNLWMVPWLPGYIGYPLPFKPNRRWHPARPLCMGFGWFSTVSPQIFPTQTHVGARATAATAVTAATAPLPALFLLPWPRKYAPAARAAQKSMSPPPILGRVAVDKCASTATNKHECNVICLSLAWHYAMITLEYVCQVPIQHSRWQYIVYVCQQKYIYMWLASTSASWLPHDWHSRKKQYPNQKPKLVGSFKWDHHITIFESQSVKHCRINWWFQLNHSNNPPTSSKKGVLHGFPANMVVTPKSSVLSSMFPIKTSK